MPFSSSKRPQSAAITLRDGTGAVEQRRRTVSFAPEEVQNIWDRPNWPLTAASDDMEELEPGTELREGQAVQGAVVQKSQDHGMQLGGKYGYTFDEHEVSDIEEEEEDLEEDDAEMLQTPSTSTLSQSQSRSPSHHRRPDSPSFHLQPTPSTSESHKTSLRGLERPTEPSPQPNVSLVHEGEPQQHHAITSSTASSSAPTSDQQDQQGQQDPPPHPSSLQQPIHSQSNGQTTTITSDDNASETRDSLAVPITPSTATNNNSPVLQQGSRLSYHAVPSANNSRASLAKAPMHSPPSHRRTSTRSSHNPYNTTQIPSNKERLRYSWQSLQDDEPNRPRIHIIKLVSNTATASAGFPTGEAFGFSISPGGRRIAAYNSARLYLLQTAALPVGISQDYALKRRPLAVELTDEGNIMAILTDGHTVNIYDLEHEVKRTRTIKLDFHSSCIALAPTGGLLAAAYEGGVEIFSLDASALPTDRRAVRSIRMDRMTFSEDGSTLLGTTTRINVSSTVVVSVPVFPSAAEGTPTHAELKEAWCSELLHPENIRNSSHATFMRDARTTCNDRLFAWNGLEDTFGLLHVADMHYGNAEFPVVIDPPLSTCGGLGAAIHSCPAIDEHGDTVAMIVNDRTIRLYIVPRKQVDESIPVEAHSIDHELDEGYGCPFSEVRWVHSSAALPSPADTLNSVKGRLIVTSPGGVSESGISEESVEDIEGGRIILFDFDPQFAGQPGQTFSLTLGKSPPQTLEEEQVDVAEQVALVRKRTVNQRERGGLSQRPTMLGRAATTYNTHLRRGPSAMGGRSARTSMLSIGTLQSEGARSLPDLMENGEQSESYEEPYVQGAPRSQASLQRAASNAQRHRYQALEERSRERISVDSNGNFLPLPEYTEEPNAPLPQRFRALAGLETPAALPGKPSSGLTPDSAESISPPALSESFTADQHFRPATNTPPSAASIRPSPSLDFHLGRSASPANGPAASIRSVSTTNNSSFYPTLRGGESYRPASPAASTRTLESVSAHQQQLRPGPYGTPNFLPRSLQRAYSNAVSPLPANESRSGSRAGASSAFGTHYAGSVQEEDEAGWDIISPVAPSRTISPLDMRRMSANANPNRFSQQHLQQPGTESRNASVVSASTAGGYGPSAHQRSLVHDGRRLPPHILAFRMAAAENAQASVNAKALAQANVNVNGSHAHGNGNGNHHVDVDSQTSASLFPATVPLDQIPLRQQPIQDGRAGVQAHPITGWRPPAPAVKPGSSGSAGGKKNKKGLFSTKKKERVEEFGKTGGPDVDAMSVWIPEKAGKEKCAVM